MEVFKSLLAKLFFKDVFFGLVATNFCSVILPGCTKSLEEEKIFTTSKMKSYFDIGLPEDKCHIPRKSNVNNSRIILLRLITSRGENITSVKPIILFCDFKFFKIQLKKYFFLSFKP